MKGKKESFKVLASLTLFEINIYMLFTGREGRIGKNCARGLEYGRTPAERDRKGYPLYGRSR